MSTILVSNADTPFGRWAVEALADTAERLIAMVREGDPFAAFANVTTVRADCAREEDWTNLPADPALGLIVHCPAPAEAAEPILSAAWLASKYAQEMIGAPGGTLVIVCPVGSPERDAALAGTRLAMTAALLDAMKRGLTPRSNRLVVPSDVSEDRFKACLALLSDARSRFMTGAELALTHHASGGITADPRLDGKTILVTGATSGIGRATAIEIGRLGGFVAVGGRKPGLAEETLALVHAAGGDGMVVSLDVTQPEAWSAARAAILDTRGALHGLVNNAGESRNRPIGELALDDLNFLLGINYRGTLLGMDHCLEPIAASGGAILNIASVAGIRAGPGGSAYGGSKAAVIGLSHAYAAKHAASGRLRINAVQPGLIWSDSVADSLGEEGARAFRAMIEPKTPLGRVGRPEEVAAVIAFLLSDAAAAISGQAISVSGGLEFNFP